MTLRQPICTVMTLLLLSSWGWAAEEQASQNNSQAPSEKAYADISARANGEPVLVDESSGFSAYAARFGWWGVVNNGSPAKTGEYQDVKSSPFWDIDGLSSNGTRTLNLTLTGNDQETNQGKLYFYKPGLSANVDYERFIHRFDHDPINNIPNSNSFADNPIDPKFVKQDLNVGDDHVVRVQELNASFRKNISDNLKVRLDVWGLQKDGSRQVSAISKCYSQSATSPPDHPPVDNYSGARCHVLSQTQQIDWITAEIKPVIEARLGDSINIEYSRPMRNFTAADSTTTRFYNGTGRLTFSPTVNPNPYAYAVVPDSYTQMDQLKISSEITENTRAYAFMMAGKTVDREIDLDRWFNDMDVRITNTSFENLSLTGYGAVFNEAEALPNTAVVTEVNQGPVINGFRNTRPTTADVAGALVHPINYHKSTAGLKGVWRPYGGGYSTEGLALAGGYEFCDLERKFAVHNVLFPTPSIFEQPRTTTNSFQIGPDYRWSSSLDTFVRYKFVDADRPLAAVQQWNGLFNSRLPEQDHIVEFGFNWVPSDWFVLNASIGIERGDNHSDLANFDEENYPISVNAWYAVSKRFSLSAGYAVFANYVTQDISIADQQVPPSGFDPITSKWNYGAQAHVITLGSRYCATDRVRLTGALEWVRGRDAITNSTIIFPTAPTTVTDIGTFSEVTNETTRLTLGVDWTVSPRIVNYYRYELYNFLDKAPGFQTGTAQGVLGGLSAMF